MRAIRLRIKTINKILLPQACFAILTATRAAKTEPTSPRIDLCAYIRRQ